MRTQLCNLFGIDVPIFAFTHCRDVVAAVSKAGGLGVLGAVGFSPEQLEIELRWIDEHISGKPYGVDTVMPASYAGKAEGVGTAATSQAIDKSIFEDMIPDGHKTFVEKTLRECQVPRCPSASIRPWTACLAGQRLALAPRWTRRFSIRSSSSSLPWVRRPRM